MSSSLLFYLQTLSLFSPLPLFGWKTEFLSITLIGFHLIQAVPICVQNADTAKDYSHYMKLDYYNSMDLPLF